MRHVSDEIETHFFKISTGNKGVSKYHNETGMRQKWYYYETR